MELRPNEGGVEKTTTLLCEHVQELRRSDVDPAPIGPPLSGERMRQVEAAILLYWTSRLNPRVEHATDACKLPS